ncbi:hypothetical protein CHCC20335_3334 [Bacillus paralicheniformis]|nr:hypothetical protein CHCC20335_3334 [Bacillus paralicheniformis]
MTDKRGRFIIIHQVLHEDLLKEKIAGVRRFVQLSAIYGYS